jgi:hypothetical protein
MIGGHGVAILAHASVIADNSTQIIFFDIGLFEFPGGLRARRTSFLDQAWSVHR